MSNSSPAPETVNFPITTAAANLPRMFSHATPSPQLFPFLIAALLALICIAPAGAEQFAGAARVDISPSGAVPLMGYGSRAKLPAAAEVAQRIHARVLAIGPKADPALLITIDNCILPDAVAAELRVNVAKLGVRPERIALTVTHTHSAPCLTGAAPNIFGRDFTEDEQQSIDAYTTFLIGKIEEVAAAALAGRQPALLAWGKGSASFAKNRRTAGGPVDHDLPVLRVTSLEGRLRALFLSYACHCTTLVGDFNAVHGDWAGVAADKIEQEHEGAVALVAIGCGADANPEPRGTLDLAVQHGREIASEASRVARNALTALDSAPECKLQVIQLPFDKHFTREEWETRRGNAGAVGYHATRWLARLDRGEPLPESLSYPVQTWTFGEQLVMVFLAGEVVVDYSLRLKDEFRPEKLWTIAYSNTVPCYIPSRRILAEGGYEAESSLWYYHQPQRLATVTEDLIIQSVSSLIPNSFKAAQPEQKQ